MQRWLDIIHCISLWHKACELQNKLSPLPNPLTSNQVVLLVALVSRWFCGLTGLAACCTNTYER
jgi:hypothetical protein